jgi:AraC family transcriptional regulator of adaptative response/methylated-DNA-[protein]-cysteine methyltransferase
MTKKSSKSKVTDQTALSYGFGKTTLGKILVATSDKGVVSILIDGSNAKLLTDLQSRFPDAHLMRNDKETSSFVKSVEE